MNSNNLAHVRRYGQERISLEDYADRSSRFLHEIISNFSSWANVEQLDAELVRNWFSNPFDWGYNAIGFCEGLEATIMSFIDAEFRKRGFRECQG
jgi:hypothetical protein